MPYGASKSDVSQLKDNCVMFSLLSEDQLVDMEMHDAIRTYSIEDRESMTFRGGTGKDDYYALSGNALYRIDQGEEATLDRHGASGCKPLYVGGGSAITITAKGPATICRTDHEQIDYMISWEALIDNLESKESDIYKWLTHLRNPAVFMKLPFENVVEAVRKMRPVEVKAGDEIITQGETGETFFVIESGKADVWQQGLYDDEQKLVARLRPGDHFGDEALIIDGTRNASVRMTADGTLLTLEKANFDKLIQSPLIERVNAETGKRLIDEGRVVLDVRYEEEFRDTHLPNVTLIPLFQLRDRLDELDKEKAYLVYCFGGKRSAVATMIMRQHGIDAACLQGGIRDWPYEAVSEY